MRSWKSPNFEKRAGGVKPSMIIIHYTGMRTEQEALERLCDPDSRVSSHYFVGEGGDVLQLVDDDKRAWHAGFASWEGVTDVNSNSIGIEIVNPGHEHGYRDFSNRQIQETIKICKKVMSKWPIKQHKILGHSDIAPKRKEDPGELFPWRKLAVEGIGLWPKDLESGSASAATLAADSKAFQAMLLKYGYSGDAPYERLVGAFHRHFYPEIYQTGKDPGVPDKVSAARLMALMRLKT